MPANDKDESKPDQAPHGDSHKMSESNITYLNSSSQTEKDSESLLTNGNSYAPTLNEMVAHPAWSLISNDTESDSSFLKDDDWKPEGEFEVSYVITVKGFGHYEKEENRIANRLMRALNNALGEFEVKDEAGRTVVWDKFHPERPVVFKQP